MPTNTNAAEERHLARLCYLLGYASHRLPAETQLQWELADVGDPLPPPVVEAFCQVETCAAEVIITLAPQFPTIQAASAACNCTLIGV